MGFLLLFYFVLIPGIILSIVLPINAAQRRRTIAKARADEARRAEEEAKIEAIRTEMKSVK